MESERAMEEDRGKESSARRFSIISLALAVAMMLVGGLCW